jgi:hypothetical protein
MRVAGAPFLCRAIAISGAAPGTTCGNHRADFPRHLRASPGTVFAVQLHELIAIAGARSFPIPPYKRGVRRFETYCAHNFEHLIRRVAA